MATNLTPVRIWKCTRDVYRLTEDTLILEMEDGQAYPVKKMFTGHSGFSRRNLGPAINLNNYRQYLVEVPKSLLEKTAR